MSNILKRRLDDYHCERSVAILISGNGDCFPASRGTPLLAMTGLDTFHCEWERVENPTEFSKTAICEVRRLNRYCSLLPWNLLSTTITKGKKLAVAVGNKKALTIGVKNDKTPDSQGSKCRRAMQVNPPRSQCSVLFSCSDTSDDPLYRRETLMTRPALPELPRLKQSPSEARRGY
jgi:hypothetical protein